MADLLRAVQTRIKDSFPALVEELDAPSRIILYRIAPGMKGVVFTLIPSLRGVKLGFYRGRELNDPSRLLEGSGKVHATINMNPKVLASPELQQLLESAINAAYLRNPTIE